MSGSGSATATLTGSITEIDATLGATNAVTYTPDTDVNGSDTLTVTLNDGGIHQNDDPSDDQLAAPQEVSDTIDVTIDPVPDPPVTGDAVLPAVDEDTSSPPGATVTTLLSGYDDADDDALAGVAISDNAADASSEGAWQYSVDGGALWGDVPTDVTRGTALQLTSSTRLRFKPVRDYSGAPGGLTLHAIDASGTRAYSSLVTQETADVDAGADDLDPDGGTLSTQITSADDGSSLEPDEITVEEDQNATGNVLDNDTDIDDTLSVASFEVSSSSYDAGETATISNVGTLTIDANGSYTFTPDQDRSGTVPTVTYATNTGASATLDIEVSPVNDVPVLTVPGGAVDVTEGQSVTFSTTLVDVSDPDNTDAQLRFRIEALPTDGVLRYNGGPVRVGLTFAYADIGLLRYTHDGGSATSDAFGVTLRDGAGGVVGSSASPAQIDLDIVRVNEAPTIHVPSLLRVYEDEALPFGDITVDDEETADADLTIEIDVVANVGRGGAHVRRKSSRRGRHVHRRSVRRSRDRLARHEPGRSRHAPDLRHLGHRHGRRQRYREDRERDDHRRGLPGQRRSRVAE